MDQTVHDLTPGGNSQNISSVSPSMYNRGEQQWLLKCTSMFVYTSDKQGVHGDRLLETLDVGTTQSTGLMCLLCAFKSLGNVYLGSAVKR